MICSAVVGHEDKEAASAPSRRIFSESLGWVALGAFMLTLPVSFPALVLYKKVRKEKLYGKGAGILFLLWVGTCVVWLVVGALVDVYLRKGIGSVRTFFWVFSAWLIWTAVVILVLRLLFELVVGIARMHRWWVNRSRK